MDVFTLVGKLTLDGLDKADKQLTGLRGQVEKHRKAIGVAMLGMATAVVGGAVASVKAFADMGDEVQKMSLRTNWAAESLSELRHVAEISGTELGAFEMGTRKLNKAIVDASDGLETYVRDFDKLGLSATELKGMKAEEAFWAVAEALATVDNEVEQSALALNLFGRTGTQMLPMLKEGKEGIKALRQEAHDLGIVFDEEAANAAAELKDNLARLNSAVTGLKFTVAKELVPSLEAGIPILTQWAKWLGPIIENTLNWQAAHDKTLAQRKAWDDMIIERRKALGGLKNDYEGSVTALESVLKSTNQWNGQSEKTIQGLKEEIKVRGFHTEDVSNQNEVLQEQLELQKEQEEAYQKVTEQVNDVIEQYQYERSEAGKLALTVEDVQFAFLDLGGEEEELIGHMEGLGDEADNVNAWLKEVGLTAKEVNFVINGQKDEVDKLRDAYKKATPEIDAMNEALIDTTTLSTISSASVEALKVNLEGLSEAAREETILAYQRGRLALKTGSTTYTGPHPRGAGEYQFGGLITEPTWLTKVGDFRPYGIMAERGPERITPSGGIGQKVNVFVELDGRTIAKAIGQPLVDVIRVKTGVKI